MYKPITIFEAIKRYSWPEEGNDIKSLEIILGEICNASCFFCCSYNSVGKKWLKINDVKRLIREAKADGCWLISFSGGEALMCPWIKDVISYSKKQDIAVRQVISNGLLLSNFKFASELKEAGLNEVKISIHSTNPERHDSIVGVYGAFKKIEKAFNNMNRLKIKVSSNFAIMSQNYKELLLFVRYMEKRGITGYCFMFSFFSGKFNLNEKAISYSEIKPYIIAALNYMRLKKIVIESPMLNNFVPCVLPGYENIMSDWGNINKISGVFISDRIKFNRNIYSSRKKLLNSCKKCVYGSICYGIDKGYLEKFGTEEFKPLKKLPARRIQDPLYK
jgi:MoaA/NifB/PqqE/SkfB family radical SAM enzyme